jgi:hypothetical protein
MVQAQWWMRQKDALSPLQISNHAHLHGIIETLPENAGLLQNSIPVISAKARTQ